MKGLVVVLAVLAIAICSVSAAPIKPVEETQAPAVQAEGSDPNAVETSSPAADTTKEVAAPPANKQEAHEEVHEDDEHHDEDDEDDYYDHEEDFYDDEDIDWDDYDEDYYEEEDKKHRDEDFDEEYQRYLDEMTEEMMDDQELRKEIIEEIESLEHTDRAKEDKDLLLIARRLESAHIRSQLQEQQRQMIERQKRAVQRDYNREHGINQEADDFKFHDKDEELWKDFEHNQDKIRHIAEKRVALLGSIDKQRKKAFVEYEMEREMQFRKKLAMVKSQEEREAILEAHRNAIEHLKTARGAHPGSKKQLKQVWDADGLDGQEFDENLFFRMHDVNDDGHWDLKELEALFYREARDLHEFDGEIDELAVEEEVALMREHVMEEGDTNRDGMISHEEFIAATARDDFDEDIDWSAIVPTYTDEELAAFEERKKAAMKGAKVHHNPAFAKASKRIEAEIRDNKGEHAERHPEMQEEIRIIRENFEKKKKEEEQKAKAAN